MLHTIAQGKCVVHLIALEHIQPAVEQDLPVSVGNDVAGDGLK